MMDVVITIGMPIKNRIFCMDKVLASMSSQTYPKNKIKIIFIDDQSTNGTYEGLLQWKEQHKEEYLSIQIMRADSKGYISTLRNLCISNMEGDIILFWDSDVVAPDDDALGRMIQRLVDSNAVAIGFPCYREPPSLYEKILQSRTELGGLGFTAIKRSAFDKVGLFNEKLRVNEDTEFYSRVKLKALKVIFDTQSPCIHLKPETPLHSSMKNSVLEYFGRLKWCFSYVPFVYNECIKAGSKLHLLRILYYFALPPIFLLWIINLLNPIFPITITSISLIVYLLLNLSHHIWNAKRNRLFGIVAFVYHVPCGIAISYGYIVRLIKRLFREVAG
jgi:glycosyltransferase involved in cell wall biosynthesis